MELSGNIVLLITHSGDFFTVDKVAEALVKKGLQPFRLDTDRFPQEIQLTAHFDNNRSYHTINYAGNFITTEQVLSVWLRRIWEPTLNVNLAPKFRKACITESQATLNGFWDSLGKLHWVDKLECINAASDKLRQLRVATEVGFIIPRTLVTNKAESAKEFFHQVKGKMVSKLLTPLSRTMEYTSFFLYTSVVKEEDLESIDSLRYCPMVFQEQIPKQWELRVIYVNGQVFVGALDATVYDKFKVDWRQPGIDVGVWQHYDLPEQLLHRVQNFMNKLGLLFGALDFIVTPSQDYVFLEVNPIGEWGMLEKDLNLPIANAIADTLLLY